MNKFAFNLGAGVKLIASQETGTVIGRAEFKSSENSYLIRYQAGNGRQVEDWWGESALTASQTPY